MSTDAMDRLSYPSTGAAALAAALVIGGVAAAGIALASTHGTAVPVNPSQVQQGPLPGLHDFTAPGVSRAPRATLPDLHELQLQIRRMPIPRG